MLSFYVSMFIAIKRLTWLIDHRAIAGIGDVACDYGDRNFAETVDRQTDKKRSRPQTRCLTTIIADSKTSDIGWDQA